MGTISIPQPEYGTSIEDLVDIVARQSKMTEFLVNGRIDSANVREIAGFNVSQTTLKHRSGIVGMSSAGTLGSAVRFWAGNSDPNFAPFSVTQDGTVNSTKGNIGGWTIGAKSLSDVAGKVGFSVDTTGTAPYLRIWAGNTSPASAGFRVYDDGSVFGSNMTVEGGVIRTAVSTAARIELSGNSLQTYNSSNQLNGVAWGQGYAGNQYGDVYFYSNGTQMARFYNEISNWRLQGMTTASPFKIGSINFPTQAEGTWSFLGLNGVMIANGSSALTAVSGVSGTVYVSSVSGGPATMPITFTNGVRTS